MLKLVNKKLYRRNWNANNARPKEYYQHMEENNFSLDIEMLGASTNVHASMVDVLDDNDSLIYLDEDVADVD